LRFIFKKGGKMSERILLIEDEQDLADIVAYNMKKEGFAVSHSSTGKDALEALQNGSFDIVLLDLMLPDMSGIDICKKIRANEKTSNLPIIMVTAKGEEIDRVVGFEVGADDYVMKPFSARELILRVKAVLRRRGGFVTSSDVLEHAMFRIDTSAHRVFLDGEEIALTALEFKLLRTLIERRGKVQTRKKLLEDVWDMDPNVNTRTVDKHVQRLRQKIGAGADLIETSRGIGYRFKIL
jgi:two-component system phosphate regulon response regulator PhoB